MGNTRAYIRNKEGSTIGKIVVDRDLCIAASACVAIAPETYELDNEDKAVVIDPNTIDDDNLIASAESCPVKAILLFDKQGNQIYPK